MSLFSRTPAPQIPMVPFQEFCKQFGIRLYPWQHEAFGAATERVNGRFVRRLSGISAPRGDGKSVGAAVVGVWLLVSGPNDILSSALDIDGTQIMLEHARRIVRSHPALNALVKI